jgi:hypothetical protein
MFKPAEASASGPPFKAATETSGFFRFQAIEKASPSVWREDGREIFYVSPAPDSTLMAAAVKARGDAFEVGAVTPLFKVAQPGTPRSFYRVSPDGQRFLVNVPPGIDVTPAPITVVQNWTAGR